MRRITLFILAAALVFVPGPAAALPDVEAPITTTGDFRFAGPEGRDPSPDLVEVNAVGGTAIVWFIDTSPDPDVQYPSGLNPPWWPDGGTVGVSWYTVPAGLPRPFDVRGTGVDVIHVEMGTATQVIVSCSKER